MKGFLQRLNRARRSRHGLDYLLASASAEGTLRKRLLWLEELLEWTRRPAKLARTSLDFGSGQGQTARVRHLLRVLDGNPAAKLAVARTLRSLIRDVDAVELFRGTGLPGGFGLASEATERIFAHLTPHYYEGSDLNEVFDVLFPEPADAVWIERLDDETLGRLGTLISHEAAPEESGWNTLLRELSDAIELLSDEVRVIGLSGQVRRQLPERRRIDSPFAALSEEARTLTRALTSGDETAALREVRAFQSLLTLCKQEVEGIRLTLRERGLSLGLVYQIERVEAMLGRNQILASLLASQGRSPRQISSFLVTLIGENARRKSVRALWEDSVSLLARRITERNAKTGEHYITRDKAAYFDMVQRAAGGGVITSATVLLKLAIEGASIGAGFKGVLASLNYASGFLLIQACGFTLATKQPAMTAAAIAESITDLGNDRNVAKVARELINLVRSQFAAVVGNVVTVIPVVAMIYFLLRLFWSDPLLSQEAARDIIAAHSIIGATPLFAAMTGVLLWASSIFAGMTDNWVAYRRLPEAIGANKKLAVLLGQAKLLRLAHAIQHQAAGVGGNVSLGVLLGGVPKILASVGLPFEARHVTLASGALTFAICTIGQEALTSSATWLAILGVALTGTLNVGVSFTLSLLVAERAKRVASKKRHRLYRVLLSRLVRHPLRTLLPVGLSPNASTASSQDDH